MKICPTCNQTYSDASLNFCLSDGAVLNPLNSDQSSQATIIMGQSPVTNQNPNYPTNPPQTWVNPPSISPQPQKKSKAWLWVLGIIGALVIFGGLGLVGIVALIATSDFDEKSNDNSAKTPEKKFDSVQKDDFSRENWRKGNDNSGSSEYRNGEFIVSSKQANFFYVLVTGDKKFKTWNATTTVTVRNVNGTPTNSGYGLMIHCDTTVALAKDYAFLIDSNKQSYRIAQHQNSKETTLVNWTKFPAIRSGTQTNEIQVADANGKMSFYINRQFAANVNDTVNYKEGVTGIYSSDAVPIAFSNLQLGK